MQQSSHLLLFALHGFYRMGLCEGVAAASMMHLLKRFFLPSLVTDSSWLPSMVQVAPSIKTLPNGPSGFCGGMGIFKMKVIQIFGSANSENTWNMETFCMNDCPAWYRLLHRLRLYQMGLLDSVGDGSIQTMKMTQSLILQTLIIHIYMETFCMNDCPAWYRSLHLSRLYQMGPLDSVGERSIQTMKMMQIFDSANSENTWKCFAWMKPYCCFNEDSAISFLLTCLFFNIILCMQ